MKGIKILTYSIDEIWPVNTTVAPNGGIGINWSGPIGFGELVLYWGEDNKLYADTEYLSSNSDKKFLKLILELLTEKIIVNK